VAEERPSPLMRVGVLAGGNVHREQASPHSRQARRDDGARARRQSCRSVGSVHRRRGSDRPGPSVVRGHEGRRDDHGSARFQPTASARAQDTAPSRRRRRAAWSAADAGSSSHAYIFDGAPSSRAAHSSSRGSRRGLILLRASLAGRCVDGSAGVPASLRAFCEHARVRVVGLESENPACAGLS
jgi:hypothetical protein